MAWKSDDWKRLLEDLTHRQVDTIVAPAIQGSRMGHPVTALAEIANTYRRLLVDTRIVGRDGLPHGTDALRPGDRACFEWLGSAAADASATRLSKIGSRRAALVKRVARRSVRLAQAAARIEAAAPDVFQTGAPLPDDVDLSPQDRAAIGTAWELGTQAIAMQTVVSLDGDIVTRIAEDFTDDRSASVRNVHAEAVNASLGTWELLVKGISSIASSFGK